MQVRILPLPKEIKKYLTGGLKMGEEYKYIPAFPTKYTFYESGIECVGYLNGMSLRDYFAGQALAGLSQLARDDEPDRIANYCYMIADAMMGRR
jgi:hypothetical protein